MSTKVIAKIAGPGRLTHTRPAATMAELTRAAVRYELTDTLATGQADPGLTLGMALAHAEAPATFADVTDADIEALIAGVGQ